MNRHDHSPSHRPALASERRLAILERLEGAGSVRVADLRESFGVSEMTIRRDIEALAHEGLARRVHGGALAIHRHWQNPPVDWGAAGVVSEEPPFATKARLQTRQKIAIAQVAASRVHAGDVIGFTGGTTPYEVARALAADPARRPGLSVVTNSLPTAEAMAPFADGVSTVVLTGGVRTPSDALVGPVAARALAGLHIDRLFVGAQGIDAIAGLTGPSFAEAETNRALMEAARRVCLVFDSTKWGVRALCSFASWVDIDEAISDDGLPPAARRMLTDAGVDLAIAVVEC